LGSAQAMLSLGSSGRFEGNGVATMEDNELEEGEACFYQEEDPNCDPDVAFSYIVSAHVVFFFEWPF
jgi:hypothetical protein